MEVLVALFRTVRPRQWLKNLALFAALVFSGLLFEPKMLGVTIEAAVAFCLLSSGVYIMNDLVDVKADRLHPFKKKRPIASGQLPVKVAVVIMVVFLFAALVWMRQINYFLYLIVISYLLIQIVYTGLLKEIPIIGDLKRSVSTSSNYYTLCLSCDFEPIIFEEFNNDACVVVKNPEEFARRLEQETKEQLPGWYFHHNPIEYFDPHAPIKNQYLIINVRS